MSINCYCHSRTFECETMYDGEGHYPVPAIPLQVIISAWFCGIINPHTPYDGIEYYRELGSTQYGRQA